MNCVFNMLSDSIRNKIADLGWNELTEVQERAVPIILNTKKDLLLISETSSGKTEAAFLPILSELTSKRYKGLKVIYISPLKALINDQFMRVESLIAEMNVRLMKWHGDVSQSKKKRFIENPQGILQITPESLEGFLVNRPYILQTMLKDVDYIVIDEIHAFVGQERGYHLQSILHRIKPYLKNEFRIIALSATISDKVGFAKWINSDNPNNVEIIEVSKSSKESLFFISHNDSDYVLDEELIEDIFKLTSNMKALIFCNARSLVEGLTAELNAKAGFMKYYPHHANIDKEERELIEDKIKNESMLSIISTSTLELGIDIGDVDIVIQINNTSGVSSLKQRVGRSGRRANKKRILQLYTNTALTLLPSIASIELIKEGVVESPIYTIKNQDYLFHQILSMCVSNNGVSALTVTHEINQNPVFSGLSEDEIIELINHMLRNNYLEFIKSTKEFGLGVEGEKLLKGKEFYAFFETPPSYEVLFQNKKIGLLDKNPMVQFACGYQFILAGRKWIINGVDDDKLKIYVEHSKVGAIPKFMGGAQGIDSIIKKKIHYMLSNNINVNFLNEDGKILFNNIKSIYAKADIRKADRLIYQKGTEFIAELFLTNAQSLTLFLILKKYCNITCGYDDLGNFTFAKLKYIEAIQDIDFSLVNVTELYDLIKENLYVSKYCKYLPDDIVVEIFEERFLDVVGLEKSMNKINIIKCDLYN